MVNDFLFELGTEELPSLMVDSLSKGLLEGMVLRLKEAGLQFESCQRFATPRRIALWIKGLDAMQPDQHIVRKGPAKSAGLNADGQPTPALLGFSRSCGVDVSALQLVKTDKGEWFQYEMTQKGETSSVLLPTLIHDVMRALPIAKPMRWGSGNIEFARPVHWVLMLLDDNVIDCEILGVKSGRYSYGHRFHAPEALSISHPALYEQRLSEAFVLADFEKRQGEIKRQLEAIAGSIDATAVIPEALLQEVTSIVEWPIVLKADFNPAFLEVPPEVLIASMQAHQKCFALKDNAGKLLPCFLAVSNIKAKDPALIVSGNEKVMRARLSDAAFFYTQDRKFPLEKHMEATQKVVFEARLGSIYDKTVRVKSIVQNLCDILDLNEQEAIRAVCLSKCDLLTGMVGEFPELQGLMGYYYALHDGESSTVALSLNEQYMPRFSGDELPQSSLGLALSLADRIDTLLGIFALGQKPSGVKDPFKLRRHALAIIRMLIESKRELSLDSLLAMGAQAYQGKLSIEEACLKEVKEFILERLYAYYQAQGISSDRIMAVRVRQEDQLCDLNARLIALETFLKCEDASSLTSACKRVNNLLNHASLKELSLDPKKLSDPAEKALFEGLHQTQDACQDNFKQGEYLHALNKMATLRPTVDIFFEQVMVMVEDETLRTNRLALLNQLQTFLQSVAEMRLLNLSE